MLTLIVIDATPSTSRAETVRRLAKRQPPLAVALLAAYLWSTALYIALFIAPGLYLTLYTVDGGESRVLIIALAVATPVGPVLAEWARRRSLPLLDRTGEVFLQLAVEQESHDIAELTPNERAAVERVKGALVVVQQAGEEAESSCDASSLMQAHAHWRKTWWEVGQSVSRRIIRLRLNLVSDVLVDATLGPDHAAIYGATIRRVAIETREAIDQLLQGAPVSQSALMWPYTYGKARRSDKGGPPHSLRTYIEDFDREHGL